MKEIENMSLREKIAQMIMIRVDANYYNKNSWNKKLEGNQNPLMDMFYKWILIIHSYDYKKN